MKVFNGEKQFMADKKYLDDTGLAHVWSKIKEKLLPSNYTITSSYIKVESGTADTTIDSGLTTIKRIYARSTKSLSYELRLDDATYGLISIITQSGVDAWQSSPSNNQFNMFAVNFDDRPLANGYFVGREGTRVVGFFQADENGQLTFSISGVVRGETKIRYVAVQSSIKQGTITINSSNRSQVISGLIADFPVILMLKILSNTN